MTDDYFFHKRAEVIKLHGLKIPFKNSLGDIIGDGELIYEDQELKASAIDKITGIRFKSVVIPKEKIID